MENLPKIALGAWAWGNAETFGNASAVSELKEVFDCAMENGLNFWDTAAVYTGGRSEAILGELTANTAREKLILSTKFTPNIEDGTPQAMRNMLGGSMERLRTNVIDLYWIHHPTDIEKYTPMLIPLVQSGLIRAVGVSNHDLSEIKRAEAVLEKAGIKLSAVQNHYSILNRSSEDSGILDYCKKNKMSFFAYMVLEQGALSGKYGVQNPFPENTTRAKTYNPLLPEIEKLTARLRETAAAHGVAAAQIAAAWAVAKGTVPIVGVTKASHVEDAARAAAVALSEREIADLESAADSLGLSTVRHWEKVMK